MIFGAGLILGAIRVPFIQPILGKLYTVLIETPLMMLFIWRSARAIVSHLSPYTDCGAGPMSLFIGVVALLWMMIIEISVVTLPEVSWWAGIRRWLRACDAFAGSIYNPVLLTFSIMPWVVWRRYEHTAKDFKLDFIVDDNVGDGDEYCSP